MVLKICERSLQALLSSRAPLLPHTSLVWLPFARPNGEHGEQLPLPLNGIWVRKCTHVQGCQLSQIIERTLHCLSYLTVNIKGFLINSGMPLWSKKWYDWWEVHQSGQMLQCHQDLFCIFVSLQIPADWSQRVFFAQINLLCHVSYYPRVSN